MKKTCLFISLFISLLTVNLYAQNLYYGFLIDLISSCPDSLPLKLVSENTEKDWVRYSIDLSDEYKKSGLPGEPSEFEIILLTNQGFRDYDTLSSKIWGKCHEKDTEGALMNMFFHHAMAIAIVSLYKANINWDFQFLVLQYYRKDNNLEYYRSLSDYNLTDIDGCKVMAHFDYR